MKSICDAGLTAATVRIVYLGTPEDSVPPLRALVGAGHDVAFVVTQPDRRRSRGAGTDPSPVRRAGRRARPPGAHAGQGARDRRRGARDRVRELGVVVAFGQLLPVSLLEALPLGFVNLHFSLLPRWRGAAPVERAILAGDAETGVCLMQLEAGLDTGPVLRDRERCRSNRSDTAGELRARLVEVGTRVARRAAARDRRRGSVAAGGGADVRREAHGRRVPARSRARRARARPDRARGQPPPGRVDAGRRQAGEGVAGAPRRSARRAVRARCHLIRRRVVHRGRARSRSTRCSPKASA